MRRLSVLAALCLVAVLVFAPTTLAQGQTMTVSMEDNYFDQADITVEPGTTDDGTTTTPPADESGDVGVPPEPAAAVPDGDTSGGVAAPEAAPDGPGNDTPPPPGSEPEQFEDFCAQNPGAC
jgi:hypothetical protein